MLSHTISLSAHISVPLISLMYSKNIKEAGVFSSFTENEEEKVKEGHLQGVHYCTRF